ncbi:hypothetical protein HZA86_02455 [Candidatus Uhrbacteria bacterium]|nr:hypothetical protein [Candidatus Uhrbacteria bacterium]
MARKPLLTLPMSVSIIGGGLIAVMIFFPSVRARVLGAITTVSNRPLRDRDETVRALTQQLAQLQESCRQQRDNQQLEQFAQTKFKTVTARIIGVTALSVSPSYILDRGAQDGVRSGMAAIVDKGIVVGIILETQDHQSTLIPITHPRARIAGTIMNEQRTIGIVEGSANLSLQFKLIPTSEVLTRDQVVTTSGLQSEIPRGLTIGLISEVHQNPADIFQYADIRALADVRRFGAVGIVLGSL